MKFKRREFIKRSALTVGGVLLGAKLASAETSKTDTFDPYELVPLGKTKIKTTRFCLGTGMNGGMRQSNQTRLGKEKLETLIKGSYERGIRAFDLADLYGTHPFFASAMSGIPRENYAIFSKIWWAHGMLPESERPDPEIVVQRFLKELKTDYIDLVLLHCVSSGNWPENLRSQMDSLEKLKSKGIVRAVGVSCHSLPALKAVVSSTWVDSVHARINPYGIAMDASAEAVAPVLKQIKDAGKGVVGMKLIGAGELRNNDEKRDASVSYVLGLGSVDLMTIGCESLAEVDDFAARVRKVKKTVKA